MGVSSLDWTAGESRSALLAAIQAGIATVMLPARNRRDIEDVPEQARNRIRFVWLERVDDAIDTALNPPQKARAGSGSTAAEAGGACPVAGRIDGYSTRGFDPRN
jgi:hypothetical protein